MKNVFVIFNGKEFTKEDIVIDIKEERYSHYFMFYCDVDNKTYFDVLKVSDEVWTFGDCSEIDAYKSAVVFGSDLWKMK